MWPILIKAIKGNAWPLAITSLIVFGFGLLVAISYSSLGGDTSPFPIDKLPRGITALLKAQGDPQVVTEVQWYLGIGLRHPIILIVLCAFGIATASSAIAGEVEQRTLFLLLSRPLSRHKLVLSQGPRLLSTS